MNVWRGPDYVGSPATDFAGVGWILAEDWWPYQRPSFVTPPFAGYVSGHSTFSRAAAEVMTAFTGDAYFPGGMGEFVAPKDEFLVFEEGPSDTITLQWATYRDASDQCSLSRIWGGIHPPADDIPGRLMGIEVGVDAFNHAKGYFDGLITTVSEDSETGFSFYPNPSNDGLFTISISNAFSELDIEVYDLSGRLCLNQSISTRGQSEVVLLDMTTLNSGQYLVKVKTDETESVQRVSLIKE